MFFTGYGFSSQYPCQVAYNLTPTLRSPVHTHTEAGKHTCTVKNCLTLRAVPGWGDGSMIILLPSLMARMSSTAQSHTQRFQRITPVSSASCRKVNGSDTCCRSQVQWCWCESSTSGVQGWSPEEREKPRIFINKWD